MSTAKEAEKYIGDFLRCTLGDSVSAQVVEAAINVHAGLHSQDYSGEVSKSYSQLGVSGEMVLGKKLAGQLKTDHRLRSKHKYEDT